MSHSEQPSTQYIGEEQAVEDVSVDNYARTMHQHTKQQLESIMQSAGASKSSQKSSSSKTGNKATLHPQSSSASSSSVASSADFVPS